MTSRKGLFSQLFSLHFYCEKGISCLWNSAAESSPDLFLNSPEMKKETPVKVQNVLIIFLIQENCLDLVLIAYKSALTDKSAECEVCRQRGSFS